MVTAHSCHQRETHTQHTAVLSSTHETQLQRSVSTRVLRSTQLSLYAMPRHFQCVFPAPATSGQAERATPHVLVLQCVFKQTRINCSRKVIKTQR